MPSFRTPSWIALILLIVSPGIVRAQGVASCDAILDAVAAVVSQHADGKPTVFVQPSGKDWVTIMVVYSDGFTANAMGFQTTATCADLEHWYQPPDTDAVLRAGRATARASSSSIEAAVPSGTAAVDSILGDFNEDGQGDLASLNENANTVAVFLGSSTGFSTPARYPVGTNPAVIVSGDFNGDGIADLATANYGDSTVSILLGNADGTFRPAKSYPAGVGGEALATADVNSDGKIDLVVANYGQPQPGSNQFVGGSITLLLGNGDGSFGPASTVGQGAPLSLVLADFTGDGKIDIAYGDYNLRAILVLPGNGTGGFGAALKSTTSDQPDLLGFGDFNGDHIEDVTVLSTEANTMAVLFGTGNGGFGAPAVYSVGNDPLNFSLLDINGDGYLDIGVYDNVAAAELFLMGQSGGTFLAPRAYSISQNSSLVVTGDFNGDGHPDFLTANSTNSTLSLFLNQALPYQGFGTFGTPASISLRDGGQPVALASGDFTGDGNADALVASSEGIAVLLGGGGSLTAQPDVPLGGMSPNALATGDFNGDGKLDFAVACFGSNAGSVAVYFGDGTGHFQVSNTYPVGSSPVSIAAADLNGDGFPDLALADSGGQSQLGSVFVLLNQGKGTFGPPSSLAAGTSPVGIAAGDMNQDKNVDLVVLTSNPASFTNSVAVLLGSGGGSFQPAILTATDSGAVALTVADYNGDGISDVMVSTCCNFNDLNYLEGIGNGAFQSLIEVPAGLSPTGMAIADFDGSGSPGLVVAASAQSSFAAGGYAVVLLNAAPRNASALNAASFALGEPLASDSIASVFGTDLGNQKVSTTSLGTILAGTTATWYDSTRTAFPADLFFVSPLQANLQIPAGMANGPAAVLIQSGDGVVSTASVTLADTAPGIFTVNSSLAAADWVRADSSGNVTSGTVAQLNASNQLVPAPIILDPASSPVTLLLFGTGIRHAAADSVTVQLGSMTVTPAYAGAQGSFVGLDQINVPLPYSLKGAGDVAITVSVAEHPANVVHITIQ